MGYVPLRVSDKASRRLAKRLEKRGISVTRYIDIDGWVMISLTDSKSGQSEEFQSPLNLWHEAPETTVALAAELAVRRRTAEDNFDRWLHRAGYGLERDELRLKDLRRTEMEESDAWRLARVFCEILGADWVNFVREALGSSS